jgi:hypothetical protein
MKNQRTMPPIASTGARTLRSKKREHKMSWSVTHGPHDLHTATINYSPAAIGDIHLHRNETAQRLQAWMLGHRGWEDVTPYYRADFPDCTGMIRHPLFKDLVLTHQPGNEDKPTFILETSYLSHGK